MARAYNVVDADGHTLEPLDLWARYMGPAFRDRAPRIVKDEEGLIIEEHTSDAPLSIGRVGAVAARQSPHARASSNVTGIFFLRERKPPVSTVGTASLQNINFLQRARWCID